MEQEQRAIGFLAMPSFRVKGSKMAGDLTTVENQAYVGRIPYCQSYERPLRAHCERRGC